MVNAAHRSPVFISYARTDGAFVERLAAGLERQGIETWFDRRLKAGSRWDDEVQAAIKTADTMVVVLSLDSIRSHAVHDEYAFALDDGDLVIPILIENCDVPLRLKRLQHIDFRSDYEDALARLVVRLNERRGSLSPVSAATSPHRPPSGPRAWFKAPSIAFGLLASVAFVWWLTRSWHSPATLGPTAAKPSGSVQAPSAGSAVAPVSSVASAPLGTAMIDRYRTVVDGRSKLLSSKESWLTAAENFEAANAKGSVPEYQRPYCLSAAKFCRANVALLEGRLDDASRLLRAAIAADSSWAPPYVALVGVLTRLGKFAEAHEFARPPPTARTRLLVGSDRGRVRVCR